MVLVWELNFSNAVRTFEGHTSRVNAVAWCPHNETRLASCGHDKLVLIWELDTSSPILSLEGSPVLTLEGHKSAILSLSWSHHEPGRLATCGSGRTLIFWEVDAGTIVKKFEQPRAQGKVDSECATPLNNNLAMSPAQAGVGSLKSPSSQIRGFNMPSPSNSDHALDVSEVLSSSSNKLETLSVNKTVTEHTNEELEPQRSPQSSKHDVHSAPLGAERDGLEEAARHVFEEHEKVLRAVHLETKEARQSSLIAQEELRAARAGRDAALEKTEGSRKAEATAAAHLERANRDILELERAFQQASDLLAEQNDAARRQEYNLSPPLPTRQVAAPAPPNALGQSVRTMQYDNCWFESQPTLLGSVHTVPVANMIGTAGMMGQAAQDSPGQQRQMMSNATMQMPLMPGVSVSHVMQPPVPQAWVRPFPSVGVAPPLRQMAPQVSQRTSPARWRTAREEDLTKFG